MDPDQTLENLREASLMFEEAGSDSARQEAARTVIDAFDALDEWLSKGGFLPRDWSR